MKSSRVLKPSEGELIQVLGCAMNSGSEGGHVGDSLGDIERDVEVIRESGSVDPSHDERVLRTASMSWIRYVQCLVQ